ncbi:MAG: M1 family metallopeptidase [Bacteroidetes bacterium]|nr:M1 family metallopeptidase [Bacteroidota bacterium]
MISRFFYIFIFLAGFASAQNAKYTFEDTLKGSITKQRSWWDVLHYDLHVAFNYQDSSVRGFNKITYKVLTKYDYESLAQPITVMQIDLIAPLDIDSILQDSKQCTWMHTGNSIKPGNVYLINLQEPQSVNEKREITIYYHGKPHLAKNAPWDGGVIWSKDPKENPWISIACQGMAGSVWYPCKDHQSDEPDSSSLHITAPKELVSVSNGRLRSKKINKDGTATYNWVVVNPINNYNIIPYIGKYVNFKDTFNGKGGVLDLNYWVLEENLEKAKKQFEQVKPMLRCFENWFGKYPFYEDGYKLVEAPFLGMEHQSAVAYGNKYVNGYMGRDLSGTGWGMKWDFIIIHESGHEWFGNNITVKDVADNWVHEGFTAYSENLFTESLYGKKAGAEYVIGTRKAILNDEPIIADYNVNRDGSGDMYYKASNMLHSIRTIINNDSLWKVLLQNLNRTFWHQTVTTKQVEDMMIRYSRKDLQKIFDQYLRTTQVPILAYHLKNGKLNYRWKNCVKGFNMSLKIKEGDKIIWLNPTETWQEINYKRSELDIDPNFYIGKEQLKSLKK